MRFAVMQAQAALGAQVWLCTLDLLVTIFPTKVVAIGLINTYSTLNLGDAAIYGAFRALLSSQELVACVQDEKPDQSLGVSFLSTPPRACQAYVSVGGDIFNNAREWLVTKAFLKNLEQLRKDPSRTILFGQSIPRSCHGVSFLLLRQCLLGLAAVCVRDAESYTRLRQAGVEARLSYDTAFALMPDPAASAEAETLLRDVGVDPAEVALVSVRAFDTMYAHDNQRFQRQMIGLCRCLLARGLRPVILVQSQAYDADNDLEVAAAPSAELPQVIVFNPFHSGVSLPPHQLAMGALQITPLAIGIRYHTSVLALASGRLPYNLHYSNKGRDLGERLSLPGCDLADFDPAERMDEIISTASRRFDPKSIREHVVRSFKACLDTVPASHR